MMTARLSSGTNELVQVMYTYCDLIVFFFLLKNVTHCQWRTAQFRPMLGATGLWAGGDLLGVSQYTGISVCCNTEQNYIVSQCKSYITVYCMNTFSRCLLVFHKKLIRIPVSFELLLFNRLINHFSDPLTASWDTLFTIEGQFTTRGWISVLFGLFSVIISHCNILRYVLWYGCHVLQYIATHFCRIVTPLGSL
jgi:hypothetical protein